MPKKRGDKDRYLQIIEAMGEGVLLISRKHRIGLANASAGRMLGWKELLRGKMLEELFSGSELESRVDEVFRDGGQQTFRITSYHDAIGSDAVVRGKGREKQYEFCITLLDEKYAVATFSDVTMLERLEMVLKNVDPGIVRWCFDHRQPAGAGTHTLASSPYWYLPMMAGGKVLAVLVLAPREGESLDLTQRRLIGTLAGLGAQALLRIGFASEARQTLVSMESERLRHGLIQSLSNDLRTPITLLKKASEGFLEKVERSGAPADLVADAEKLFDGASRMEHLAINLQDMAKLQSSDFELHRAPVGVRALFESAIAEMGAELEGYKVEWNLEENLPMLDGDEELLRRVIVNLLDNAAKYCPEGSRIILGAKLRGDRVAVTVSDNGPGLPEGNPQRLFDPFRRGQAASGAGIGLGLSVCRTIARAHDAEIFAMPSRFGGAAFTLTLPYWEEPEEEKGEEKTSSDKAEKTGKTEQRVEAPAEDADAKPASGKTA